MGRAKAILVLLSITVAWGLTFPVQKVALIGSNPFFYNFLRFALASALTFFILRGKPRWKEGLILGLFLGIGYATQTSGLKLTSSTKSGFITSLYIPFVPVFSLLIERVKPSRLQMISFCLSIIGLYLLSSPSNDPFNLGDLLTLFCAIAFAIQIVLVTHYTNRKEYEESTLLLPQLLLTALFNLLLSPLGGSFGFKVSYVIALLFTSIVATVIALWAQLKFQACVGSNSAALIYTAEPVFASLFAFFLISEKVTTTQFLGMIVLVVASVLGNMKMKRR
ncbi:DMT family transporter [Pseudothermotoga sp.]|nr:DMT family transporter [Pseudothermotoga sp.]MCX7812678.1 DMT family transporter [Pseudothermotoga sp.]MDW8138958.1 DMT family transporter [Pseudothermotoga sp.]